MSRVLRLLLIACTSLLAAIALAWFVLLHTDSGARFAWSKIQELVPDSLEAGSLDGDLSSGFTIEQLRFRNDSVEASVGRVLLSLDIDLLPVSVELSALHAEAVEVRTIDQPPPADGEPTNVPATIAAIRSPVPIYLTDLRIDQLTLMRPDSPPLNVFDSLTLVAGIDDDIIIDSLDVASEYGRASLSGNLERLSVILESIAPRLAITGDINDLAGQMTFDLNASTERLEWPPQPEAPSWFAENVDIDVAGSIDRYEVSGSLFVSAAEIDAAQVELLGHGTSGELTLESIDIAGPWIESNARVVLNWADQLQGNAGVRIVRLDPGVFVADWPDDHTLQGAVSVMGGPQALEVETAEVRVEGTDVYISANGAIDVAGGTVDGALSWRSLQWPVDVAQPAFSSPSGDFTISGRVSDWSAVGSAGVLVRDLPPGQLTVAATGDAGSAAVEIVDGQVLGGQLDGDGRFQWSGDRRFDGRIELDGVRTEPVLPEWPGRLNGRIDFAGAQAPFELDLTIDDLRGELRGMPLDAQGRVAITGGLIEADGLSIRHGTSELTLDGNSRVTDGIGYRVSVADIQSYLDNASGSLETHGNISLADDRATIDVQDLRLFRADELLVGLEESFRVDATETGIVVERGCVTIAGTGEACLAANWNRGQSIEAVIDVATLPVSLMSEFVRMDIEFQQSLTGQLRWLENSAGTSNIDADVRISPGKIVSVVDPDLSVDTGPGSVTFHVADRQSSTLSVDVPFPGFGHVDIDVAINDISRGGDSGIDGRVNVLLDEIDLLTGLVPALDSDGGRLQADLELAGTVSGPQLDGSVMLRDAAITYLPLGTVLSDLDVEARLSGANQLFLDATFRAGDGTGQVTTTTAGLSGEAGDFAMHVSGEQLLLVDAPELKVVVNPDLFLGFYDGEMEIDGSIVVPELRLAPTVLPQGRAVESEDVVIVAGADVEPEDVIADEQAILINGDLQVTLGDNVAIALDVAAANLAGTVDFSWHGDAMPTARGDYSLNGTIRAYGQVLTLTDSAIRFPGVPANNPVLAIRAEREIFGNSQIKTAGVRVTGRADNPVLQAYTNPLTTEERALTLLATGSDFDYEQGVGALGFGTYIAPRLFLSYGVGLFDNGNVISARYDLERGFGIKASSGQRGSGVDLIYRIDN